MTEELNFEAYLIISRKKFEIQLLDKKNLKNIFKEQTLIENYADLIDYNLLSSFLNKTIFKIEKLIAREKSILWGPTANYQTLNFLIKNFHIFLVNQKLKNF